MEMKDFKKIQRNGGQAMITAVIFFLIISLLIISGLVVPTAREFRISSQTMNSKKAFYLAESGLEDVAYRVIASKPISSPEIVTIDSNTATTSITTSGSNQKEIVALGDVTSFQRKLDLILQAGAGVGFNYGIQAGDGGFSLSGGSQINGNVYSNGSIQATNKITGTAIAAGAASFIGDNLNPNDPVAIGTGTVGDAWAYKVVGANVAGNLYCQVKASTNKNCNTSKGIPPAVDMPFTQDDIDGWKAEGTAGGIITGATKCHGGYSGGNCTVDWANATFGPGKITGNLTVTGTLTLTGTVYVVGKVTVSNGGIVKLPANFNQYSATIISDGYVSLSGGSYTGSGVAGSYLFVVTTSTCPTGAGCSGNNAISMGGGSGTIAVAAQSGTVDLGGGISIEAAVGKTISAHNGAKIFYETGLASPEFVGGTSGGWNVLSWQETD
jgi:Tfp pilus assembly protein PilX